MQRETLPDAVVRARRPDRGRRPRPAVAARPARGRNVYPAERIDAALSNYFRLGNLTALRELALLWLADEVDSALNDYRAEHGIEGTWQARERVVVALTGGPEGETLLRRGARIAARSAGGELLAVHVSRQDGLRARRPGAARRSSAPSSSPSAAPTTRSSATTYPARSSSSRVGEAATQLVIGVSRRGRLAAALTGPGIGATVIRESGDIDVHIVTHAAAGGRFALPRITGGALSVQRRVLGFAVALIGGPLLTWLLFSTRSPESITSDVLAYQLLVVLVALIGGIWPALFAAVLSGLTLDFLFVAPRLHGRRSSDPLHVYALLLYVVIAILVSYIVDQAARRARAARRAEAEAELLATVAGNVLRGESAVPALVTRTREAFGLAGVRLIGTDGAVLAADGEPLADGRHTDVPVGKRGVLELHGGDLDASERRLLDVIVAQLDAALEHTDLTETAATAGALAETDQVRTRTPLRAEPRPTAAARLSGRSSQRTADSGRGDDRR